ncbi:MAG: heavy metal translocating P-type ATPase [Patescibacteria group bacterium]
MQHETGKTYTCPMHPEVQSPRPGMCPECGMALVKSEIRISKSETRTEFDKPSFAKASVDKHAGHSLKAFVRKFWVSFILTIPVVAYSELPERFFGLRAPQFLGSDYLSLVLSSVVFFYCGWIFLASAVRELKARLPGMMTLIAIAITAAYLYSIFTTLAGGENLFWELTTLITVMLLGHWMEMKSVQSAQGALKELSKLLPDVAEVVRGDATVTVPLAELKADDIVLVRPGGKVPADGVVLHGRSEVNEAIVTGESKPVQKNPGSEVIAGTGNGDGALKIKVTKIGEKTFLAGIMRLVAEAQASKSRLQMLSDAAAYYLTLIAIAAGTVTFVAWIAVGGGVAFAVERFVAVLVITCPHALGLAIPLVASISTTMAARNGLLVRERRALEAARNIDVVLFDKTGTLTKGEYAVEKVVRNATSGSSEDDVLRFAASVDAHSEHFVARAIVAAARERGVAMEETTDFARVPGKGAKGAVAGAVVHVGGEAILGEAGARLPDEMKTELDALAKRGRTIIFVAARGEVTGAIALADIIREESRAAILRLKAMGVKVAMVTGDSEDVARWVAEDLGIDEYFARVLPDEKAGKVKALQEKGLRVAMVGDGVNDAPALTQADLGIAIGAGTNVAIESAGIILVKNDPRDIPKIIRLSRLTYSKMLQNLFWATGYNVVALPLAAGVLASQGIILQPALSALFMSVSTVVVAINALLLRNKKLEA